MFILSSDNTCHTCFTFVSEHQQGAKFWDYRGTELRVDSGVAVKHEP